MLIIYKKIQDSTFEQLIQYLPNNFFSEKPSLLEKNIPNNYSKEGFILVKLLISKILNIPLEKVIISYTKHGKPFIKNKKIFFNLSHSKNCIVIAFSKCRVGIDIEEIKKTKVEAISQRFFTVDEYTSIQKETSEKEKHLMFYKFWTAKESYTKLIGTGLTLKLNSFKVNLNENIIEHPKHQESKLHYFYLYNHFQGCISTFEKIDNFFFWELSNRTLQNFVFSK